MQRNAGIAFDGQLLCTTVQAVEEKSYHTALTPPDVALLISCLDLTTLAGDDTEQQVLALCRQALEPSPGRGTDTPRPASVCVYPVFVPLALEALAGSSVRVATVAAAFPHGLSTLSCRVKEVGEAVALGAHEVDVVIRRSHALCGEWEALYDEVCAFREAAEDTTLKVILATGELSEPEVIFRAGVTALMAGADFIKTSTGKETVNATLPAGAAMAHAIRTYAEATGFHAGLKPAGGIRTSEQAAEWLGLVRDELGSDWLTPAGFRIGASALLGDLVGRLPGEH